MTLSSETLKVLSLVLAELKEVLTPSPYHSDSYEGDLSSMLSSVESVVDKWVEITALGKT